MYIGAALYLIVARLINCTVFSVISLADIRGDSDAVRRAAGRLFRGPGPMTVKLLVL